MAGKKLLVADDSLTIQKVIRLALSNEGYDIQAVSNGAEALEQLSLFRPNIVLIDVALPGKSAFEIKRWVNAQNDMKPIQFVLMSSAFEKVDEVQMGALGFAGQLTKPFDPALLRKILADVFITAPSSTPAVAAPPPRVPSLPPVTPSGDDLWGSHFKTGFDPETEIKTLTESTFQMNESKTSPLSQPPVESSGGSGDFDWAVQEPSMAPPSVFQDVSDTTFEPEDNSVDESPAASYFNAPESPTAFNTFAADPMAEYANVPTLPVSPVSPPPMSKYQPMREKAEAGPSSDEMETLVRRHLQSTIEEMTRRILPEVAEKVIRAEINRLLSEMN
jgi:CheY-like chemotaxis protein